MATIDLTAKVTENDQQNSKRERDDNGNTTDKKKVKKKVRIVAPKAVFVVLRCNIPLENCKWGEHSGHETEDTKILGVYTNARDANMHAFEEFNDDDDEEFNDENDDDLFDETCDDTGDWTGYRVWVEEKELHS